MIARRLFLGLAGGVLLMSRMSWATDEFPSLLDHILLGCNDLDAGIAYVEKHTGVRAGIGGVHPGRGTRNALLALGTSRYLEIIAPDPAQKGIDSNDRLSTITQLTSPKLIGWAAHVDDIDALARELHARGVAVQGPQPGSRKRPDGRLLEWKTLGVEGTPEEVIPFFIEWSKGTVHPSVDAPGGCHLEAFSAGDTDPAALTKTFRRLSLDVPVYRSAKPELRMKIVGPKGSLEVGS